ncbi:hypothetical protein FGO68_gene12463 [Halteria grandinella]|uniref:Uncharacterized protein n=1 Tax=Halteria grandinella TaxID=5974 RepID=A0A8J8NEG3_HALGN|nr:hypothetical protein FGO68_gene12463 [Halteria grandinella]
MCAAHATQNTLKQQFIKQCKVKNRFLCQECKCRKIQCYCGRHKKFACFKCILKVCNGHSDSWEEVLVDTIANISDIIDQWDVSFFSEGFKTIGREIKDPNIVIIDRELELIVDGLKTLHKWQMMETLNQQCKPVQTT